MLVSKKVLLDVYGNRCMLCKKEFDPIELQRHHIIPRYEYKRKNEEIDDTIANLSLLCTECHRKIHKYDCRDSEYIIFTISILESKVEVVR